MYPVVCAAHLGTTHSHRALDSSGTSLRLPGKTNMSTVSRMDHGPGRSRPPCPFMYLPTRTCSSGSLCVSRSPPGVTRTLARELRALGALFLRRECVHSSIYYQQEPCP